MQTFFFLVLNVGSFDSYFMNVRPTNLEASEVFLVARVLCICLCQCSTVVFLFFFLSFIFLGDNRHACWLLWHLFITAWKLWNFFFLLMQYFIFLCLYYIVRCNVVCFLHNSDLIWWQLVWIIILALFQIVLHFLFYVESVKVFWRARQRRDVEEV